jgi:hypothetical protein
MKDMVDDIFSMKLVVDGQWRRKKDKRYVSGVQEKESVSTKDMKKDKEKV